MEILRKILSIFLESGIVVIIATAFLTYWFNRRTEKVKNQFKRIEISESFKYQMRLAQFSDLNLEKFNACKMIHNKIAIAFGKLSHVLLGGFQVRPDYSSFNENEMESYLKDLKVPQKEIENVKKLLSADPSKVSEHVETCIRNRDRQEALHSMVDSWNHYVSHRLYIEHNKIDELIKGIHDQFNKLRPYVIFPATPDDAAEFRKARDHSFEKINKSIEEFIIFIRKNFSVDPLRTEND